MFNFKGRKSSVTSMEESIGDDDDSETHNHHNEGESKTARRDDETDENRPDFKCLLVTGHNDSSIKIWNENVNTFE